MSSCVWGVVSETGGTRVGSHIVIVVGGCGQSLVCACKHCQCGASSWLWVVTWRHSCVGTVLESRGGVVT